MSKARSMYAGSPGMINGANAMTVQFGNKLQEGLDIMGFEKPTPIQKQAIPIIQNNYDLIESIYN